MQCRNQLTRQTKSINFRQNLSWWTKVTQEEMFLKIRRSSMQVHSTHMFNSQVSLEPGHQLRWKISIPGLIQLLKYRVLRVTVGIVRDIRSLLTIQRPISRLSNRTLDRIHHSAKWRTLLYRNQRQGPHSWELVETTMCMKLPILLPLAIRIRRFWVPIARSQCQRCSRKDQARPLLWQSKELQRS